LHGRWFLSYVLQQLNFIRLIGLCVNLDFDRVPSDPFNLDQLHKEDMRGQTDRYWPQYHVAWISMWNDRHNRIIHENQFNGNSYLHDKSTYMQWYINHIIRYISLIQSSSDDDVHSITKLFIILHSFIQN